MVRKIQAEGKRGGRRREPDVLREDAWREEDDYFLDRVPVLLVVVS